jgi:hypothetical protein
MILLAVIIDAQGSLLALMGLPHDLPKTRQVPNIPHNDVSAGSHPFNSLFARFSRENCGLTIYNLSSRQLLFVTLVTEVSLCLEEAEPQI